MSWAPRFPGGYVVLTLVSTRPVAPGPVDPDLPDHAPQLMEQRFGRSEPDWTDRDSVVDHVTACARLTCGSRGFDERDVRPAAGSLFDRARHTAKAERASHLGGMFAAIDCRPRWRERLGEITAPTLVVHGGEHPLFPYGNGMALAAEISGATLLTLAGIGPGVRRAAWPAIVNALMRHASRPLLGRACAWVIASYGAVVVCRRNSGLPSVTQAELEATGRRPHVLAEPRKRWVRRFRPSAALRLARGRSPL